MRQVVDEVDHEQRVSFRALEDQPGQPSRHRTPKPTCHICRHLLSAEELHKQLVALSPTSQLLYHVAEYPSVDRGVGRAIGAEHE